MSEQAFWLTNVRLESGYRYDGDRIQATETELCHLWLEDGRIRKIQKAEEAVPARMGVRDAGGALALPAFVEMHAHLDKTLLGEPWKPLRKAGSLLERLEAEKSVQAEAKLPTADRAEQLLARLQASGVTRIRTHADLYPEAGLRYFEAVQQVLETYRGRLASEIVAFPQHGLLRSDASELVKEALRQGARYVGGVDPAGVDGKIEASLQRMVELAVEFGAGIDLHLHDPGHLGTYTLQRLAALTEEAGLQGKVWVSHAYALGDIPEPEAERLAEQLSQAGIGIITSVPISRRMPPVPLLHRKGVRVSVGSDNVFDAWSPFGSGDLLERAGLLAQRFGRQTERALAETLGFVTGGVTPLDAAGNRQWPQEGDEASLVLLRASCSAEAVARRSPREAVLYKGRLAAGSL